jgi:hypothetical protein
MRQYPAPFPVGPPLRIDLNTEDIEWPFAPGMQAHQDFAQRYRVNSFCTAQGDSIKAEIRCNLDQLRQCTESLVPFLIATM